MKVFNIGFHKTGTTSLSSFMHDLGFRVLHDVAFSMQALGLGQQQDDEEGDGKPADFESLVDAGRLEALIGRFDFFSDNPWPLLYRRLDQTCPGSLFILTRRKVDSWINSLLRHCGTQNTRMRRLVYGYGNPHGHVGQYRKIYLRHNREVLEYFRGKDNLLVIDLEDDNDVIARRVVEFLGIDAPGISFPVANKR